MTVRTLLILGGTGEAIEIAGYAHALPGLRVISSLAGRTAKPADIPGELRRGGFGGIAAMRDYLSRTGIDAVIDASHPFATTAREPGTAVTRA